MSAPFDNVVFDLGYDYGAIGGPAFNTQIQETQSGKRLRTPRSYFSRGSWSIGNRIITGEKLTEIKNFFEARKGRLRGFLWKDWTDFKVPPYHYQTRRTSTGIFQFQLTKQYGDKWLNIQDNSIMGTYQRPIFGIVESSLEIRENGAGTTHGAYQGNGVVILYYRRHGLNCRQPLNSMCQSDSTAILLRLPIEGITNTKSAT